MRIRRAAKRRHQSHQSHHNGHNRRWYPLPSSSRDTAGLETVQAALVEPPSSVSTRDDRLDPRRDRLRLLTLTTDTCDGGKIVYVVDALPCRFTAPLGDAGGTPHHRPQRGPSISASLPPSASPRRRHGHDDFVRNWSTARRRPKASHGLAQTVERELGRLLDKTEQKSDWWAT